MSRSRKRTPIRSVCLIRAGEVAAFKRMRARRERARLRTALDNMTPAEDGEDLAVELAPWDEWDCPRDGKLWFGEGGRSELRRK